MRLHTALGVGAALVALAFALVTFERWLGGRHRRHALVWSVALLLFSLGSAALAAGAADGWSPALFRAFFLFGAILNVPFLAVGTVYLRAGRGPGDRWLAAVLLFSAFAAGVMVAAPLTGAITPDELPQGSDVLGPLPRALAALASGGGALVVLAGSVGSGWRARRGRLLAANVLVTVGVLVLGAGGLLNSVVDEMTGFAVTLVVGVTILFAGFLLATAGRDAAAPSDGSD